MASKKHILDPKKTLAILIGNATYTDFQDIGPAVNNVSALKKVLLDKNIFGLNAESIHAVVNKTSAEIKQVLMNYTEGAKAKGIKTLILYFTGHGFRRPDRSFFLAGKDTIKQLVNEDGSTGIAYEFVKNRLRKSGIPQSIILLDSCYSGTAILGEPESIELKEKGAFVITSSESKEPSYFDKDETHTLFSGELLKLLKHGVPIQEDRITLSQLFDSLNQAVRARNPKMSPQYLASKEITGDNFYLFKNQQYDPISLKKAKVQEQINKANELLADFRFDAAIRTLENTYRMARPSRKFEEEIELIHERIDACEEKQRMYLQIQAIVSEEFEDKLAKTKRALAKLEAEKIQWKAEKQTLEEELEDRTLNLKTLEELFNLQEKEVNELKAILKEKTRQTDPVEKALPPKLELFIQGKSLSMIPLEGATYLMGSDQEDSVVFGTEQPQHSVTVDSFYMAPYPVTEGLWKAVMGKELSDLEMSGCEKCPVGGVSWNDVTKHFLPKLNALTKYNFRLPTEAEWEFAARGGKAQYTFKYAGSNKLKEVGWYSLISQGKTHAVGQKQANNLGLYDMSGNVWEWCQDGWNPTYEGAPSNGQAWETENGAFRVIRGGSFAHKAIDCRVGSRSNWEPDFRNKFIGFRLALDFFE